MNCWIELRTCYELGKVEIGTVHLELRSLRVTEKVRERERDMKPVLETGTEEGLGMDCSIEHLGIDKKNVPEKVRQQRGQRKRSVDQKSGHCQKT